MSETRQKAGSRGVDSPRRRWSEAQRRRIVAESYRSGDSASAVARRYGVHTSVSFRWRRRYRTPADTGAGFVPVMVDAPEPSSEAATGRMEIVLGDGVRVVVDATVHAPALARVLAVVYGAEDRVRAHPERGRIRVARDRSAASRRSRRGMKHRIVGREPCSSSGENRANRRDFRASKPVRHRPRTT